MNEYSAFTEAVRKYSKIPLLTLFIVFFCCSLYLVDTLDAVDVDYDHVCLQEHGIKRLSEVYRMFSYVFFHKRLLPLAVTMIPIAILGWIIEKRLGTILFFLNLLIIWLLSTLLEVAMVTLVFHVRVLHEYLYVGCTYGMSGIVFGLVVLLTKFMRDKDERPWWGIPSCVYPLTLLGFYFIFIHKASLYLHLGGIFAGYACKHELMTSCLPNPKVLLAWERTPLIEPLTRIPCFVGYREPAVLPTHTSHEDTQICQEDPVQEV